MKKLYLIFFLSYILAFFLYGQQIEHINFDKIGSNLRFILQTQIEPGKIQPAPAMKPLAAEQGRIGVVIKTDNPDDLTAAGIKINSRYKDFVTARITLDELITATNIQSVRYIQAGEDLKITNDIAGGMTGAKLLNSGYVNNTNYTGKDVLLCIIDTGIDFKHLDFRNGDDTTESRIIYLWDQTITKTGSEKTPQDRDPVNMSGLDYGVEYSREDINDEIDGTPAWLVREVDSNGHGSHVCGTAAGNGSSLPNNKYAGIAPDADLLIIKAGNGFFPNVNIIDALAYAGMIAEQLGKPIVVNLSLGSQANAHDGTDGLCQAVDQFTAGGNGRVVVISAGNEGDNLMHITGSVSSSSTADIYFSVPAYTSNAGSSNDYFYFYCWCSTDGDITAAITSPNNYTATRPVETGGGNSTNDGYIYLSNYIDYNNNDRELYAHIYDRDEAYPPVPGTWDMSITNNTGGTIIYHGWLASKSMGLSVSGADNHYVVGSPGTATNAITVGAYDSRWSWFGTDSLSHSAGSTNRSDNIAVFSSIGPRRDGMQKPDITAPGKEIISVKSANTLVSEKYMVDGNSYLVMQGTSMASPVVTGAVALLLQENPNLNYNQIKSCITGNAVIGAYTGTVPNYSWGYGKLNIFKSMVDLINSEWPHNFSTLTYDEWNSNAYYEIAANVKFAVRFTPDFSGKVSGAFIHTYSQPKLTSPLYLEIWSDNSGLPEAKLGSTVTLDQNKLCAHTWTYIDMTGSGAEVLNGTDYHLVAYFNSGDKTGFEVDNGNIDGRSSKNSGSGWSAFGYDFRMRTLITPYESALPVEFVSFTTETRGEKIYLTWHTASEVNNYGFDIERLKVNNLINDIRNSQSLTLNGHWTKIGFVKGNGNSNSPREYSFTDRPQSGNGTYYYRLKQIDNDGKFIYSNSVQAAFEKPAVFTLEQNYPNPFNPYSTINYSIPEDSHILLKLYDVLGREIKTLINKDGKAGTYSLVVDANELSSGIYLYKLTAGKYTKVKKMVVIK